MSHHVGEGYSGRNPVPTVSNYLKTHPNEQANGNGNGASLDPANGNGSGDINLDRSLPPTPAALADESVNPADAQRSADTLSAPSQPQDGKSEKERILTQSKKSTPLEQAKANKRDDTVVDDPTTGAPVHLENAKPDKDPNAAHRLDPANADHSGPALNPPQQNPQPSSKHINPNSVKPTNILLQQFPKPVEEGLVNGITGRLRQMEIGVVGAMALVWFFVAFGSGKWAFVLRTVILSSVAFGSVTALHLVERQILKNINEVRMQMERQRGEEHSPPTPESVEWLNAILATTWKLAPPELFTSLTDMIEDVMQASLPKFITAVRIADLGQGRNPLRIVAMRGLPDVQGERLKHGDDWIDQGKNVETDKAKDVQAQDQADQAGDFVNMEISLAYMSVPKKQGQAIHADNAHMMLEFFVGLAGWARIPIRIWVEVSGIVATARVRLQMVEQMPFIRNCTVTLMGTPYVNVSAVPLSRALPNVLDMPFVSGFVQSSIAAACQMYTAPQSITMNLAQLLLGDGTKKDTLAVGVVKVTIHHAKGLEAADSNGKSDPYVVAAWSKFGKPLYSTRVMVGDLNPVWEETCFLLVTQDEIASEEKLSIQLWDSDARSADDVLGRVEVELLDIMKNAENKSVRRTDKLRGFEESQDMQGEVEWSYGFFRKVALEKEMKDKADQARQAEASEEKSKPDMEPTIVDTPVEAQTLDTPPNPKYPSGIFSIIISNINNLENQNLKGASGKSMKKIAGKPGQPTAEDAELEEHTDLPSSYCEIMVNDDLIYRTRTKEMTSAPYFAAGTERFLRDYHSTVVRVAVRDARLREHDALLGVVTLPLGDLFKTQSQVTRLFSLQDGVGFGRVNISLLFKGVSCDLPRSLRGWETGTVEIVNDIIATGVDASFASKQLLLRTTDDAEKIPKSAARQEGNDVIWTLGKGEDEERRLPVYHRFASALVLDFGGTNPDAVAVLWLQDIVDNEEQDIELDIMQGKNLQQLSQCYISEYTKASHPYDVVGKVRFRARFDPGLDEDHEKMATDQKKQHVYNTYMAAEGANTQLAQAREGRAEDDPKTKREKKLETQELHRRGRGVMQIKPVRTLKWMGDGFKSRAQNIKSKIVPSLTAQQPDVETEV